MRNLPYTLMRWRFFPRQVFLLFFLFSSLFSMPCQAIEMVDQSANMFAFQQKLANKGNAQAQYKLGFMYETGQGVNPSREKALDWYARAAAKGNQAARNRMQYLQIRQQGYDPKRDAQWLAAVRNDAFANQVEAVFLLGQLYHEGLGVKKNLDKALALYYKLGSEGIPAVDREISLIEKEKQQAKRLHRNRLRAYRQKQPPAATAKTLARAATPVAKVAPEKAQRDTDKQAHAEKAVQATLQAKAQETAQATAQVRAEREKARRERYLAIMKKLAKEQEEIDRLQGWAEGKSVASIDDEI